jgi:drug/metabolite transporter (DMT)-like permease
MVLVFGLAVGVLGMSSMYLAVKHVSPLLCTLVGLAQPVFAGLLG